MATQWSTAFSELVLVLFSFLFGYVTFGHNILVASALFITGVGAVFGLLRFGLNSPSTEIFRWHNYTSRLAFAFTPSFLASVYVSSSSYPASMFFAVAPFVVIFVLTELSPSHRESLVTAVAGLSVVAICCTCFSQKIFFGFVGCGLLVAAAAVMQVERSVMGLKKTDLFHYLLIPSLYFLAKGVIEN